MVAAFGLGGGWEALDRAIAYSTRPGPGRRPAVDQAGFHPQADRAARGASGGGARVPGGDRGTHRRRRRRRRRAEHRRRDREVPGHRGRQRRRRSGDPGARRVRLHPAVPGGEDQARRPDHHDLRGHLGDPGDDDRPRPLAAAPQTSGAYYRDAARALDGVPERLRRAHGGAGAGVPGRGAGGLPGRSADPQSARPAAAGRARSPTPSVPARWRAGPQRPPPAHCRTRPTDASTPAALAAVSRVFAREAAQKVAEEGLRWVAGAGRRVADLAAALPLDRVRAAQTGLLADMDRVADALYGREAGSS